MKKSFITRSLVMTYTEFHSQRNSSLNVEKLFVVSVDLSEIPNIFSQTIFKDDL